MFVERFDFDKFKDDIFIKREININNKESKFKNFD